jgi:hypothetical protein
MFAQVRITHLRLLWLRICCVILVRTLGVCVMDECVQPHKCRFQPDPILWGL